MRTIRWSACGISKTRGGILAAKVYSLIVKCEKKDKRKYGLRLYLLGLRWDSDAFYGCVKYKAYRKIWAFCEKHGIPVKIDKSYAVRSSSYRKMFFEKHKPQLGKYYVCAYCGKLLLPENVTVDHLYPIKKARESREIQRKLRKMGIMDINDPRNLVPACAKCNGHKAAKTGLWIFRGQIGRSAPLWIVRKILRICLFLLICYIFYEAGIWADCFEACRAFLGMFAALFG